MAKMGKASLTGDEMIQLEFCLLTPAVRYLAYAHPLLNRKSNPQHHQGSSSEVLTMKGVLSVHFQLGSLWYLHQPHRAAGLIIRSLK